MRAHTITTTRLALPLSLLALGALGLIACGGDDDKTVTSVVTETVTVAQRSCGMYPPGSNRWTLEVEGDFSCVEARRVMRGLVNRNLPPGWVCSGPEGNLVCDHRPPGAARSDLVISATL